MIKPFAHQTYSIKHNAKTPLVYDVSDPGTGKTYVRIMGFAARRKKNGGCMLVLAPRSLLRTVWVNDFKKFAPHLRVVVADAANREQAFNLDADVYITNVDAVKWLKMQKKSFFDKFSELAIDESTAYKHHTSQRSKAAAYIARFFKHKCCMTGTPNGNTITDVWHQVYLLDGGDRLGDSFYKFRDVVCTPKQIGRNSNAIQWTDRDGAEEAVFGLISDIVVRHRFEDCVDIPSLHQYCVGYDLAPKQLKSYFDLEASQLLTVGAKSSAGPRVITAINAAAVATKLLQVASGAVYDGTGGYAVIDRSRYELILDLVQQRQHSLTFFLWKHQRDELIAEAEKRGVTFAVIDGSTSDSDRERIVKEYQDGAYQTIFAHPKSAAHGLTLTRGTATIWSSPTYDLEIFKQGSKRQHRMGQTQKTENIVVLANGTIEQKVYDMMLDKDARMTNLLDLFGSMTDLPKLKEAA